MQHNYPFRRVFDLDSAFNERASPRSKFSDIYGMFDMNNGLFPQYQNRLHNFILDPHSRSNFPFETATSAAQIQRGASGRPGTSPTSPSSRIIGSNHTTTATAIPVVHLPSSSSPATTPSSSRDNSIGETSTSWRSNSSKLNDLSSKTSGFSHTRKDSEAEVDALTNILIKSMGRSTKDSVKENNNGATKIQMTVVGAPATQQPYSTKRAPSHTPVATAAASTGSTSGRGGSQSPSTASLSRQSSVSAGDCHRCRKNLEQVGSGSGIGSDNSFSEPICGPLNTAFHQACFSCYRCGASLNTDSFFYAQKRLLCTKCVHESLEKCTVCNLVINDRIIRVLGRPYHPKCFTCVACGCCLDGLAFTVDVHERTYCLDDFHRRYAPRCDACGQPIRPNAPGNAAASNNNSTTSSNNSSNTNNNSNESRRIISGRKTYHIECFGVAASGGSKS